MMIACAALPGQGYTAGGRCRSTHETEEQDYALGNATSD
jgi:hypothetical protein